MARKGQPREQRRDVIALRTPPPLDHEAASGERPCADGGAARASHGARELGRVRRDAVELRQRTRDGESELCTRAEPGMLRKRPVHAHPGAADAAARAMVGQKPSGEVRRPLRVLALHFQGVGRARRDEERRRGRRRADAAVQSSERAAKVEQSEMKACRHLDVHRFVAGRGLTSDHACPVLSSVVSAAETERTCSVSSAIASNSGAPAVLSTMICSRASSLSMNVRGSRCRRVM